MKIEIDGEEFHYLAQGEAGGLPVVFLHGFPFSSSMWKPQLEALPPEYRAYAYDLRGLGANRPGDGQYTIEAHVDDLLKLMDAWKIPRAVVVGLSMGGYIALRALEREGGRFLAAVLADTRSEADGNEAKWKRAKQAQSVKADGAAAFAESFLPAVFAARTLQEKPQIAEPIRRTIAATSPLAIAGTLLALAARSDTTDSLNKIKIPTLILVGEHDAVTPPEAARAMHRRIPGSRLETLPEAAHMSNLENPAAFNGLLLEFLRSLLPKP